MRATVAAPNDFFYAMITGNALTNYAGDTADAPDYFYAFKEVYPTIDTDETGNIGAVWVVLPQGRTDAANGSAYVFPLVAMSTNADATPDGPAFPVQPLSPLPNGTVVAARQQSDRLTGKPIYTFEPLSQADVICSINDEPSATDTGGLYPDTVIDIGQATGFPTAGMTVPETTDAEFCNLAEQGLTNHAGADYQFSHWCDPGYVVSGFLCGTSAATGLPLVAGSMPNPYAEFEVVVAKDGGTSGTVLWTYKLTDLNGKVLGTGMTPVWNRLLSAVHAIKGMAFYDGSGNLQLATTDSVPPGLHFEVTVSEAGGSNGTVSGSTVTNASYTYTASDLAGNDLTSDGMGPRTPTWNRPQGILTGPATHGVGYFNSSGVFVLAFTDEQGVVVGCASS
nr:hypothetical protein [uncultured Rhodopila sp.]